MREHNPGVQQRLGSIWLESSSVKGTWGSCGQQAQPEQIVWQRQPTGLQDCIIKTRAEIKKVIIPLSTCQATPRILHSVLVSAIQKRCGQVGKGPDKGDKDDQRTGKLPCEERQRELDSFSLENKRRRDPIFNKCLQRRWRFRLQAVTCKRPMVIDTNNSCRE